METSDVSQLSGVCVQGLKKTWDQLHHEYQCLPLVTETMSQKSHRQRLETKMAQLENDIELIQRFKTIYVRS